MAHFFNFSINDQHLLKLQADVLRKKYNRWRYAADVDKLERERKIRAYVLEAITGFKCKEGQELLSDHPASDILNRMIGWLDCAEYEIRINKEHTMVRIWSNRGTYVEKEIIQDTSQYPECLSGGIMGAIQQGLYEERQNEK